MLVFFTQTLCKSFKIHCVVPIPQTASLRDFFKPAISGSSLPVPRDDDLLTWQKDVCKGLGLPWPPPNAKAGKPSRQTLWLRAIYAEPRAGRTLPDGVTAAVPDAWSPGDSLASTGVSDAEVVAAGELAKFEAVAKKRKRTAIDLMPRTGSSITTSA